MNPVDPFVLVAIVGVASILTAWVFIMIDDYYLRKTRKTRPAQKGTLPIARWRRYGRKIEELKKNGRNRENSS
jgi:hypothetical protein